MTVASVPFFVPLATKTRENVAGDTQNRTPATVLSLDRGTNGPLYPLENQSITLPTINFRETFREHPDN